MAQTLTSNPPVNASESNEDVPRRRRLKSLTFKFTIENDVEGLESEAAIVDIETRLKHELEKIPPVVKTNDATVLSLKPALESLPGARVTSIRKSQLSYSDVELMASIHLMIYYLNKKFRLVRKRVAVECNSSELIIKVISHMVAGSELGKATSAKIGRISGRLYVTQKDFTEPQECDFVTFACASIKQLADHIQSDTRCLYMVFDSVGYLTKKMKTKRCSSPWELSWQS